MENKFKERREIAIGIVAIIVMMFFSIFLIRVFDKLNDNEDVELITQIESTKIDTALYGIEFKTENFLVKNDEVEVMFYIDDEENINGVYIYNITFKVVDIIELEIYGGKNDYTLIVEMDLDDYNLFRHLDEILKITMEE